MLFSKMDKDFAYAEGAVCQGNQPNVDREEGRMRRIVDGHGPLHRSQQRVVCDRAGM